MNTLLLCFSVLLQGAPAQAELHPARADLYVAVPDVQAIVAAYGEAPMLLTTRDPGMSAFLSGLAFELENDPRELLRSWIEGLAPGAGALLDTLHTFSFSFTLDPEGEKPFGIGLVATFASPEDALAAQQLALGSGNPVGPVDVAGLTGAQSFTSPEMEGMELWCVTAGARFALGGGSTTVEGFAARLAKSAPGLASNELVSRAAAAFGEGAGATVCWMYQARSPFEILGEADQASSMLGGASLLPYESIPAFLDPFGGRRILRMQLCRGRFVTQMYSPAGTGAGALGGQPLDRDWLKRVAPDAMFAYSTAIDGKKLAPRLQEMLGFVESQGLRLTAEEEAATDPFAEALAGLGPRMVTYMFPVSGIGAPQTHAWIEVDDAGAFSTRITKLCEELAETRPGFSARTRPHKVKDKATGERTPFEVTTITLPPDALSLGPMLAISPAFAAVENKLLFGLSSMHVKRELKRLYGGGELEAADPWSKHGFEIPEDARSVVFMDWGMQIEAAVDLARAFGAMAGDQLPFDLGTLPAAKTLTQFMRPTFHVSRDVQGGTYRYHEASFGPETWFGLTNLIFAETEGEVVPPPTPQAPGADTQPAGDGG